MRGMAKAKPKASVPVAIAVGAGLGIIIWGGTALMGGVSFQAIPIYLLIGIGCGLAARTGC